LTRRRQTTKTQNTENLCGEIFSMLSDLTRNGVDCGFHP
jgi:hypothetical protein